jgi:hypothetical protein
LEYIASLSRGKDSAKMLDVIVSRGLPLDRIVTVDIMATDKIPAMFPSMVEFAKREDAFIKERYGIEIEHFHAPCSYEEYFYSICGEQKRNAKSKYAGQIYGFPFVCGPWCQSRLKEHVLSKIGRKNIQYIGIAADEPNRFHNITKRKRAPLVEFGIEEDLCGLYCRYNDILAPVYENGCREGCWFCHNQGLGQLRLLRKQYPEYWALMLKWDKDSPVSFKPDGTTVHDLDRRFALEDTAPDGLELIKRNGVYKVKMII